MKISPLGDRVLLKPIEEKAGGKTSSGIYLPESAKEDRGSKKAEVVAVGPGRTEDGKLIPPSVKVGQIVLYSWGDTVKSGDQEYVMVRESDILAIIK
ncbi:MAG TPA: co-chaperone GroES [Candidatus Paceibacterota bacterium]